MVFLEPILSTPELTKKPFEDVTPEWAWEGSTGKGVRVAVVDSGVDHTHPELTGCVKGWVEVVSKGNEQMEYKTEIHGDAVGHATACAGIIRSIAPEVEIYSVKVLGGALTGTGNIMMAGIKWAVDNGMALANLSLGTTKDAYFGNLHKIADDAYFKNCNLISALSNTSPVSYPGVFASLIGVKAVKEDNPFSFYLNPKPPVEIFSRGIMVRIPWTKHGYTTTTGNSFATPVITGIAALIKAKHPTLNPFQLKDLICNLAGKWEDYGKRQSPFFTIPGLSRISRIPEEFLEKYVELGLISSARNDDSGNALFEQKTVIRANRVHILHSQNFSVEEIIEKIRTE